MNIRPVTDLRNHYPDVEKDLKDSGAVYLTKNGYGTAVLIGIDEYAELTGKRDLPLARKKSGAPEGRGFLNKYASAALLDDPGEAVKIHAVEKYGKFLKEAGIVE